MNKSKFYQQDKVVNQERYRTAAKNYNLLYVEDEGGIFVPCLLTNSQLANGIHRAENNPEDVQDMAPCMGSLSFLQRLKFLFTNRI